MELHAASPANGAYSLAGMAIGTSSAAAAKVGNTTTFAINGKGYSKTTAEVALSGTTLSGTTANGGQSCIFLVCCNAAGTLSATQGPIVDNNDVTNGKVAIVPPPNVPENEAPFGYVLVSTDNATDFIPGTTLLSASGITDNYVNLLGGMTARGETAIAS